ncbi:hypothetical protein CRUP_003873 [Coryphaenoides rupestris]|nr:hypothetical protein CRUP_003873 [Coryphaenoides rupestris]
MEEEERKRRGMEEEEGRKRMAAVGGGGEQKEEEGRAQKEVQDKVSKLFSQQPDPWASTGTAERGPVPGLFDQKVPVTSFDQQQQPVKVVYYRALYPFDARSHDEISITPGDIVMVANYAERIPDSEAPNSLRSSATATPTQQPVATPPPAPGQSSTTSSASSNWADFSTTWPSTAANQSESEGWDAWPTSSTTQNPSLGVPSAQLRQRSAFTPRHHDNRLLPISCSGTGNHGAGTAGHVVARGTADRPEGLVPQELQYMAMYTYESSEQGDLSFQQGDVVVVTRKEGDWWTGVVAGKTGVFPSNYVKPRDSSSESLGPAGKTGSLGKKPEIAQVIAPYSATGAEQLTLAPANYVKLLSPSTSKTTPTEPIPPKLAPSNSALCQVIGMYDYVAQNDDELAFLKGQVITVISKDDCDWWKGELNGREGLFPSNYVKLTTDTDPSTQWCADLHLLDMLSPMERKRQGYTHELIVTEENYVNDLQLVTEIFQKPLLESTLIQQKTDDNPEFKDFLKILENTPESHPDHSHLKAALEKAEELCSQVNEGVREKENSDRLEWIQAHVQCEGLSEQLVFNSVTNCLGPRKFLHSGKLFKAKSSKELYGFLFNDFLLLTQVTKPLGFSGSDKVFSSKTHLQYRMYKTRATGIGRLMVNIVEGIELKPCRSHGKSNPYCEVTMGSQCHITKTLQDTLNPKWNSNCQFFIKDLEQDVLCVTVFERDQFSPDDFLGRTEIRLAEIKKDQGSKGPITKRLLLHEVPTGEIVVRLDLQLFEEP